MKSLPLTSILVADHLHRAVEGARVTAGGSSVYTDARGRAALHIPPEVPLEVRARGFEAQTRALALKETGRRQQFVLGRAGMAYYYRGKTKVPFERIPGVIGVMLHEGAGGTAVEPKTEKAENPDKEPQDHTKPSQRPAVAEWGKRIGAEVISKGQNFELSGVAVLRVSGGAESAEGDADDNTLAKQLREILADPAVAAAGALVQLSSQHAAFLTDLVIAHFEADVDDKAVAALAKRHGLLPVGRFPALGNVYRLRFPGPASYALLDAANALAEEPDVVYAEPNLAATSEDDAITPSDFLFGQQWDHQIIGTPDAWQALRDMDPARTFGNPDVVVAVVDTGVDDTHPEFSGTLSNGAAKQLALFDFSSMVANMDGISADHGTACASAAVANTNNASVVAGINEGISGVAGNCRLLGIRRGGTESRYAEAYLWAGGFDPGSSTSGFPAQLARGADVITSSYGFSVDTPISGLMSDTFDTLTNDGRDGRGVALFFSAGNDNVDLDTTFRRPWSMYDRCFGVAAATLANDGVTEVKANYSNFGSTVDWCLPSNDNEGLHNPGGVFGAHAATIEDAPGGDAIPGHAAVQSTLAAAAGAGAMVLTLNSAAGFAVNQAVLVGVPGAVEASGRLITAVNAGANQISINAGLGDALPAGAPVAAGPRSYQTGFGGTSYATPVAAGTAALMLSANPDLRWDEVRDLMRATAVKIDPNNSNAVGRWRDVNNLISTDAGYLGANFSEWYGFGRINAAAAVQAAGWRISLQTPALNFNDVPEGETTLRAVRFDVQSLWPVNFNTSAGPGVPFTTPLGAAVFSAGTASADTVREVILWVGYTGTTAGDSAAGSVTVRNSETGREWVVPITANTVQRQTACVMLSLDRSGSMLSNSGIGTARRIDVLHFSAEIMVDMLHEGDGLGIVSFDHEPYDVLVPPIGPLGPVTSGIDPPRDQLRSAISSFAPNPDGLTAIGDGVERAQQRLNPVVGYDSKSVIVFTDGKETDAQYISDVAPSITDRVFAVALGRADNIQPTALTALTNGTGGYCVLTGDLDINSRYKLAKYFLQVLAGVKNEDIVRDPDGQLAQGQVHEIDFQLTEADIAVDVILMTPIRGLIDMTLLTPSGAVIHQADAQAMPGGLYFDGRNVSYYRLTLPVPVGSGAREGRWLARLQWKKRPGRLYAAAAATQATTHATGAQGSLPYSLMVHSYSNLRLAATLAQSGFAPGAKLLLLRGVLTEYGVPIDRRATVAALVRDPGGVLQSHALVETAPGVFERELTTSLAGTYEVRFMAQGRTLRNRPFTREAVRTGAVWIGGDRPAPSSQGDGRPQPDDLLCKLLHCVLSQKVIGADLRKRLAAAGFNVDALLQCTSKACRQRRGGAASRALLEGKLLAAIKATLDADQ